MGRLLLRFTELWLLLAVSEWDDDVADDACWVCLVPDCLARAASVIVCSISTFTENECGMAMRRQYSSWKLL